MLTLRLTGKLLTNHPFNLQRVQRIVFNFKFLHKKLSTNNFLKKKIGLVDSEKCTFCQEETEKLVHLFWECPKIQSFWISVSLWLQSC